MLTVPTAHYPGENPLATPAEPPPCKPPLHSSEQLNFSPFSRLVGSCWEETPRDARAGAKVITQEGKRQPCLSFPSAVMMFPHQEAARGLRGLEGEIAAC